VLDEAEQVEAGACHGTADVVLIELAEFRQHLVARPTQTLMQVLLGRMGSDVAHAFSVPQRRLRPCMRCPLIGTSAHRGMSGRLA
jgi:hypothetical protein